MSELAIKSENLGKQYRIGARAERYYSFRDMLVKAVKSPFRRFAQLGGTPGPPNEMFWALKDVSFEVKHGQVLGIIGRNGAGKTTLLKILSRVTEPTEGRATIRGRVGSLLEVGTGFHPELTGRENVFLSGVVLGMSKAEIKRKFDEMVAFAGVEKFLDTPMKRYSSGMAARLAFAVAAHLEPELLLVDEVLAVGDAEFQKKCLGKMGEVAKGGRTVLFVSHNMNAVEDMCSTVMLIGGGRIVEESRDVRGVIHNYLGNRGDSSDEGEWQNPGDALDSEWFKPLRFFLSDAEGKPLLMPIRNDCVVWVNLEAELKIADPAFVLGYAMHAEDGRLLYWSLTTDTRESSWPKLEVGKCTFRSRIEPRLLNEGSYRLELIAGLHFRQWLSRPGGNAPAVKLHVQGGLSDSPYWIAARPGDLGPVIPWIVTPGPVNQDDAHVGRK